MDMNDLRDKSQPCAHCNQLVVWAHIAAKPIPVDLEPDLSAKGNVALHTKMEQDPDSGALFLAVLGNVVNENVAKGMRMNGQLMFRQHAETCTSSSRLGIRVVRPATVIKRGARR